MQPREYLAKPVARKACHANVLRAAAHDAHRVVVVAAAVGAIAVVVVVQPAVVVLPADSRLPLQVIAAGLAVQQSLHEL